MATETNVITGLVRFSYPKVFKAVSINGGEPTYGVSILIPKTDKETLAKVRKAVDAAFEAGKGKLGIVAATLPAKYNPLKDGDVDKEDGDKAYAGHYYLSANCRRKPGVIDAAKKEITDPDDFYPGCYGRASINFFSFLVPANKGIACGLNNLQKIKDGPRLDSVKSAEDDFNDDFVDEFTSEEGLEDWEQ